LRPAAFSSNHPQSYHGAVADLLEESRTPRRPSGLLFSPFRAFFLSPQAAWASFEEAPFVVPTSGLLGRVRIGLFCSTTTYKRFTKTSRRTGCYASRTSRSLSFLASPFSASPRVALSAASGPRRNPTFQKFRVRSHALPYDILL